MLEQQLQRIRPMMVIVYGILFLIAAAMAIGLVVGATFKLIGLLFMAFVVVVVVSLIMNKVRGPRTPGPTERLPR